MDTPHNDILNLFLMYDHVYHLKHEKDIAKLSGFFY